MAQRTTKKNSYTRKYVAGAMRAYRDAFTVDVPPPENPARRGACRDDLGLFLLTYLPGTFSMPFGNVHRELIAALQQGSTGSEDLAFAAPRGFGKTSLVLGTVLWLLLYRHRSFPIWFGATGKSARRNLRNLKAELDRNDLLLADFPEVCACVRALAGSSRRCQTQTANGERTRVEWGQEYVRLPEVDCTAWPAATLRAIGWDGRPGLRCVACDSLDGGSIRGWNVEGDRPDLALFDDIETRESATSPVQTEDRAVLIDNDCAGLAGPGRTIARLYVGTIMAEGCLTDAYTDPSRSPSWHGRRYRFLLTPPTAPALWDEYTELYRDKTGGGDAAAHAHYLANREAMDAGAVVAWEHAYDPGKLASATERYYADLARYGERYAACELQNDPAQADAGRAEVLTVARVTSQLNGRRRHELPDWANMATAAIDVHRERLYWAVVAWDSSSFTGAVVEYGLYPGRRKTLTAAHPDCSPEGAIRRGLDALWDTLTGAEWMRADGLRIKLAKTLVDSGWSTATIYQWARDCARKVPNLVLPSKGVWIGPGKEWGKGRTGDTNGDHWRLTTGAMGRIVVPLLQTDSNHWKSFIHRRLATPREDRGALTLWGDSGEAHREIAEHVTAERPVEVSGEKGPTTLWQAIPGRDNHYLDTLAYAAVAASVCGARLRVQTGGTVAHRAPTPTTAAEVARVVDPPPPSQAGRTGRTPGRRPKVARWDA